MFVIGFSYNECFNSGGSTSAMSMSNKSAWGWVTESCVSQCHRLTLALSWLLLLCFIITFCFHCFQVLSFKGRGKKTPKIPADQPEHWDLFPSNPLFLTQLYCMCLIWSRHVVLCKFVQINGTLSQSLRLTKHCFACANLWRSKLTRMFYVFWKTKKREDEIQCSSRTVKFPMGGQALILLPVCMWLCVCVCVCRIMWECISLSSFVQPGFVWAVVQFCVHGC